MTMFNYIKVEKKHRGGLITHKHKNEGALPSLKCRSHVQGGKVLVDQCIQTDYNNNKTPDIFPNSEPQKLTESNVLINTQKK